MFALAGCNEAAGRMDESLARRQKRSRQWLHMAQLHPGVHLGLQGACVRACVRTKSFLIIPCGRIVSRFARGPRPDVLFGGPRHGTSLEPVSYTIGDWMTIVSVRLCGATVASLSSPMPLKVYCVKFCHLVDRYLIAALSPITPPLTRKLASELRWPSQPNLDTWSRFFFKNLALGVFSYVTKKGRKSKVPLLGCD